MDEPRWACSPSSRRGPSKACPAGRCRSRRPRSARRRLRQVIGLQPALLVLTPPAPPAPLDQHLDLEVLSYRTSHGAHCLTTKSTSANVKIDVNRRKNPTQLVFGYIKIALITSTKYWCLKVHVCIFLRSKTHGKTRRFSMQLMHQQMTICSMHGISSPKGILGHQERRPGAGLARPAPSLVAQDAL
jgi:hypothetical protein